MNTDNRAELQELIGPDYQLQWIIGHGGMSTVWLADDTANDREVAIKVLRPEYSGNEEFLARFRNEARAAEGINSANVVATYDYREIPTREGYAMCFIVMEYVRGESLADLIAREGRLDEPVALDVLEQAAHGLSVIHRMGLIHRDIKPGNLMVTQNGKVKITDFGIAKAASAVPLTRTGMVVGTAQYVSPEQAQGVPVTAASDIYSLAVVGYEMLSGRRPFTGDSSVSIALAHVSHEPPPLSTAISAPTRELIGIALRKDPATRFADGTEFQNAIADARVGRRPRTAALATRTAPVEPPPQQSTVQLAAVTEATTVPPQYRPQPQPQVEPQYQLQPQPQPEPKKSGGGFGCGLLLAVLALLLAGAAVWAYTSGKFDDMFGRPTTTTTTETTEVTTETEIVPEETEAPASRERRTQAPPSTLYNDPETTNTQRPQQPDAPQQQPTPQQQEPTGAQQPAPQQNQNAPGAPMPDAGVLNP